MIANLKSEQFVIANREMSHMLIHSDREEVNLVPFSREIIASNTGYIENGVNCFWELHCQGKKQDFTSDNESQLVYIVKSIVGHKFLERNGLRRVQMVLHVSSENKIFLAQWNTGEEATLASDKQLWLVRRIDSYDLEENEDNGDICCQLVHAATELVLDNQNGNAPTLRRLATDKEHSTFQEWRLLKVSKIKNEYVDIGKDAEDAFLYSSSDETQLIELSTTGNIPEWVNGSLLIHGPQDLRHWTNGVPIVHKFSFQDRSKSEAPNQVTEDSRTDKQLVTVHYEEEDATDYEYSLDFMCHSSRDPKTNKLYNTIPDQEVNYSFFKLVEYEEFNMNNGILRYRELLKVPQDISRHYWHSFGYTGNYIVLICQPLCFAEPLTKESIEYCENFSFNTFIVMDISKRDFEKGDRNLFRFKRKDKFAFFHVVNSFEFIDSDDTSCVACDIVIHQDVSSFSAEQELYYGGELRRFVLQLPNDKSETIFNVKRKESLSPSGTMIEFPLINPNLLTNAYRYCYALNFNLPNDPFSRKISKIDIINRTVQSWSPDSNYYLGQAVFVPNPDSQLEDDGVLISMLRMKKQDNNEYDLRLVILDAKSMSEIASICVPGKHTITPGLHATFRSNHSYHSSSEEHPSNCYNM